MNIFDAAKNEARLQNWARYAEVTPVSPIEIGEPPLTHHFLTGRAGTGKTFRMMERVRQDPTYGVLAATTGIAGVNLGAVTINSLLKYFDTDSLRDNYIKGRLHRNLKDIFSRGRNLIIDEVSMMDATQLDLIESAAADIMHSVEMENVIRKRGPRGIILTGDACQLPPIRAKWFFQADCWPKFAASTEVLEKIWRQTEPKFLEAVNAARAGDGPAAVTAMSNRVKWAGTLDLQFDGTTILPKNDQVNRFNQQRLLALAGKAVELSSLRWGQAAGEWRRIPEKLHLKRESLVMILANDLPDFNYANGDLGHVVAAGRDEKHPHGWVDVKLLRNQETVRISWIERLTTSYRPPYDEDPRDICHWVEDLDGDRPCKTHYDAKLRKYVIGAIYFHPLRLGWASTVHKVQGLSLDRIQLDCRDGFFGEPAMAYVALSRARTLAGLRIVGTPEMFAQRVNVAEEVKEWI